MSRLPSPCECAIPCGYPFVGGGEFLNVGESRMRRFELAESVVNLARGSAPRCVFQFFRASLVALEAMSDMPICRNPHEHTHLIPYHLDMFT